MAFCSKCGKELPEGATFCPSCGTPVPGATTGTAAGATAAPSAPLSGFDALTKDSKAQDYWIRRVVAYVVDAIIVYLAFYIILAIIDLAVTLPAIITGGFNPFFLLFGTFAFLGGIIFIFYFAFMESSSGASFGKRIFRLKVVAKSGGNPTFGEAFLRSLSKIYWILLLLDVIIGLAVSKNYQQKWSDQFLGTTVTSV